MTSINKDLTVGIFGTLKDRKISKQVCKKYGVTVQANKEREITKHYYPYHNINGFHVANKIRYIDDKSQMPWEGKPKQAQLFGMHLWQNKKKDKITITEGELDALAAYQMFGEQFPVVSVPNGAGNALADCKQEDNYKFLASFNEIYICFDNDEAGYKAAKQVAMLFDGKAKIVQLDHGFKDACDYLVAGKEKEFTYRWWDAEFYIPSEILTGDALLELVEEEDKEECFSLPWAGLQRLTFGYRLGETIALTAHAKIGKTYVVREVVHHMLHKHGHKVGTIFLEGRPKEHMKGFLSLEADIPFHRPDAEYTQEDWEGAKVKVPVEKLAMYKREGALTVDGILDVIRFYVRAMDCDVVVLDNLMSLVSEHPTEHERELLNKTITEVVKLGEDTHTTMFLVAHLNRQGLIHGTSLLEKQAYTVLEIQRDKMAEDEVEKNTTHVYVKENRFVGETGFACDLFYDKMTGRLTEVDPEDELEEVDIDELEEQDID